MSKLESFLNFIGHYKYLITIVLGVLYCGVLSENSFLQLMKLNMQNQDLDAEIELYTKQNEEAKAQLESLKSNPRAVEKVARERYFMKMDDEDVFVLSTDEPSQPQSHSKNLGQEESDTE